ncbi:hypothetical protein ACIQXA_07920 [Streptomyces massasporeus]|uniref:hypothetical protein n=1 Tax=Streptomyces massasporeus TaxID=67324 RepID=UPI0037F5D58E
MSRRTTALLWTPWREGIEKLTARVTVSAPGEHVLRVFMVDPGIAVDQIVIDTGGVADGYLAPPESYRRT